MKTDSLALEYRGVPEFYLKKPFSIIRFDSSLPNGYLLSGLLHWTVVNTI